MFRVLGLFFLGFICASAIKAQIPVKESDVPENIRFELGNRFPGVTGITWLKNAEDYQASFQYDGYPTKTSFAFSGKWNKSEISYPFADLPRTLQRYVSNNLSYAKVLRSDFIETREKSEYVLTMNDTILIKEFTVYFDESGAFVRKSNGVADANNTSTSSAGKQAVQPKELPSTINSYIIVHYPDHSITECFYLNNEEYANTYFVTLAGVEPSKVELYFDFQGKLVKSSDASQQPKNNGNNTTTDNPNGRRNKNVRPGVPESSVPALAVQTFRKKEPKAESVTWDTIRGKFVAVYYNPIKSADCRMEFDKNGNWTSTFQLLDEAHPLIQQYLGDNYPELRIESIEAVAQADKKKYTLVKLYGTTWINDPMVFHELYFSSSGRLEKEVLADYIDGNDEMDRMRNEANSQEFSDYIENDNVDLTDDNLVDGQMVPQKELPSNVNDYIKKTYPGFKFIEAVIISDDGIYKYSVYIKKEGYSERRRLLFDLKGAFLKEEEM